MEKLERGVKGLRQVEWFGDSVNKSWGVIEAGRRRRSRRRKRRRRRSKRWRRIRRRRKKIRRRRRRRIRYILNNLTYKINQPL